MLFSKLPRKRLLPVFAFIGEGLVVVSVFKTRSGGGGWGGGGGGGRRGLLEEGCLIEKRRCLIKIPISFTSRSCHLGLKL